MCQKLLTHFRLQKSFSEVFFNYRVLNYFIDLLQKSHCGMDHPLCLQPRKLHASEGISSPHLYDTIQLSTEGPRSTMVISVQWCAARVLLQQLSNWEDVLGCSLGMAIFPSVG